ncbi:hypothetical protein ACTFIY_011090 [Dictyostelium cf. discoideum]
MNNIIKRYYKWPIRINEINKNNKDLIGKEIKVKGWVRNIRNQKSVSFIELGDGSSIKGLQIVGDKDSFSKLKYGSSIEVNGKLINSLGNDKEAIEVQLTEPYKLIGNCPDCYPLQPKNHSFEFLRDIAHIRSRGNSIGALLRVRNKSTQLIHQYFNDNGFINVHTPIITSSDCEGGGEQFQIKSSLDTKESMFFGQPSFLTVSGQLEAEIYACSHSRVYTFGPTFRAEKSNTPRHLSEFWMIEPEMAFIDLNDNLDIAEDFLKYLIRNLLDTCKEDIQFFNKRIDTNLLSRLEKTLSTPFIRLEYKDAIQLLQSNNHPIKWGDDIQREQEKFITTHFGEIPVFVINWPKSIKPFYMRENEQTNGDDLDNIIPTVSNMDLLVPTVGELIGGSIREERYDKLLNTINEMGMDKDQYSWYLDLRKYGTVPHGGFGLGFERFLQFVTGLQNIKDVIPIPRHQNYCKF